MSILLELLGPIWPYIVGAGTAIMGLVLAYWRGGSAAKAKAKAKQAEAKIKTMQTANEVQDEVAAKSDPAVRDALGKWLRRD